MPNVKTQMPNEIQNPNANLPSAFGLLEFEI
jgi:hypothetical protein